MRPGILLPSQGDVQNSPTAMVVTTPFETVGGLIQANGDFEVGKSPDFSTVIDSGTGGNTWVGSTELTRGEPYFVRVRHKAATGEVSPWSNIRTFTIRKFFRDQRIGIVLSDPNNWVFDRIDRDFNPVNVDNGYWMNNAVWAGLEASRNGGANTIMYGQEMVVLPAFWIRSGIAPSGPYAGKRFWMIDPTTPTQEDIDTGWHIHDAFYNPNGGYQDSLPISAHFMRNENGVPKSKAAGMAHVAMPEQLRNLVNTLNTNNDTPATRGWGLVNYRVAEGLKLLMILEFGSTKNASVSVVVPAYPYRGINLWNTADENAFIDGLMPGVATLSDNVTAVTIPDLTTLVSKDFNRYAKIDKLLGTSDGAPQPLKMDDYLVPFAPSGTETIFDLSTPPNGLLMVTALPKGAMLRRSISGFLGYCFMNQNATALMCKWD